MLGIRELSERWRRSRLGWAADDDRCASPRDARVNTLLFYQPKKPSKIWSLCASRISEKNELGNAQWATNDDRYTSLPDATSWSPNSTCLHLDFYLLSWWWQPLWSGGLLYRWLLPQQKAYWIHFFLQNILSMYILSMTQQKAGQKTDTNPKKTCFYSSTWFGPGPNQVELDLAGPNQVELDLDLEMIPADGANFAVWVSYRTHCKCCNVCQKW